MLLMANGGAGFGKKLVSTEPGSRDETTAFAAALQLAIIKKRPRRRNQNQKEFERAGNNLIRWLHIAQILTPVYPDDQQGH